MTTETTSITTVLNAALGAIQTVVPLNFTKEQPRLWTGPVNQQEMGVLVGVTGDVRGRIVLESTKTVFSAIGEALFGMAVEGDLLESLVGEIGNLVGGNTATNAAAESVFLDITPPTVMVGKTALHGFNTALLIPVNIEDKGVLNLILIIEEKQNELAYGHRDSN